MSDPDPSQNLPGGVDASRAARTRELADILLREFDLEDKDHLRGALRGLNLQDPLIQKAARSYLKDQLGAPHRPVLGSITDLRTVQLLIEKVEEDIRIRALRLRKEVIEKRIRRAIKRRNDIEGRVELALNESDHAFSEYGVDFVQLKVQEPTPEPRKMVLKLVETLWAMTESELATIVEDGLLPEAMEAALAYADRSAETDFGIEPSKVILDLAELLSQTGSSKLRERLREMLHGPREKCEDVYANSREHPLLRYLALLRLQVLDDSDLHQDADSR